MNELLPLPPGQAVLQDPQSAHINGKMAVNGSSGLHIDTIEDTIEAFS